ncbi:J domain-containing protein [Naasia lichenicola]|uniref:Molecular chaperone DnaJ n=1 Tax=Naasia lichenicola TaxID=2565933 RepID=A0A4V3WTF9_9MICO|nr:J domain-containing protein [Naasia lichenicola]THG31797.1 molecular chaperone DnaJ [Naasia lichenicola]
MADSPLTASPYEILGISATASDDELRKAYRRKLRETHPDTGGAPARFHAVQLAWERIGTPEARAAFDRGAPAAETSRQAWAPAPPPKRESRPQARSHGHPGGWWREVYLDSLREWLGVGNSVDDPYDPALVRRVPREIRHSLAAAVAEEDTARVLAELGMGYTLWHDVVAGSEPIDKLDHIVLGPTGLWGVLSEDWGSPVRIRRGEVIGEGIHPDERPVHDLAVRAKNVARAARVRFSTIVLVVPDGAAEEGVASLGKIKGMPALLVERSRLPGLLRAGIADVGVGGTDLFEVRTRLQSTIRFV